MKTIISLLCLLSLLLITVSYSQADPTEIRINISYKLTSSPAEIEITASHVESVPAATERKEVEVVRSGGLAGALGGIATTIDTAGYTKVDTIVRNGKTFDVYEKTASAGSQLRGETTVKVHSAPSAEGIRLYTESTSVKITGGGNSNDRVLAEKERQLRANLERLGAQIVDQLNTSIPFSQSDIDSLFGYQPTAITKTLTYQVKGEQREISFTVNSEARRIIDAPLGEGM